MSTGPANPEPSEPAPVTEQPGDDSGSGQLCACGVNPAPMCSGGCQKDPNS
jgi:hypothetical protein